VGRQTRRISDASRGGQEIAGRTDDALMNLFHDLLEVRYSGWENNNGVLGSFDWNLIMDTLKHEHSERYVECETTEHEGIRDVL
jgi:hypothetical protein